MQEKNILVTAIGSFSADAVITSLKKQGYRVVGTDIYPKKWIAASMFVDQFYQVPLASDGKEYIGRMADICEKEQIAYFIPLTDVEIDVLNPCREIFDTQGTVLCMSPYETILSCRNKRKTSDILKSLQAVHTIPEYQESEVRNGKVKFPVFCKKTDGRSSQGIQKIFSGDEFSLFAENHDPDAYMIQPFMEGDIITVDVVRDPKGGNCVAVPRRELLRTLNGAGTSVYVFRDPELEAACERIADILNIQGCVNFEFIDTGDTYYFLECNPRFSGGVKFTCISGYDCISNHLRCFQGKSIEEKGEIASQYIARKYEEYITGA